MTPLPILLALAAGAAFAEPPSAFPPDAQPIAEQALLERIAGRVLRVQRPDGNHWRLQYLANGHYFFNTERGGAGQGTWKVEGDRLCTERLHQPRACNPVRLAGDRLYLQRTNGEVIALVAD